jgi:hypothetical protein
MSTAIHSLHASFNSGLITPKMGGRFDLEKLRTGCVELKNALISPYGGVFKRPGTTFVKTTENNEGARLIEFRAFRIDDDDSTQREIVSEILEITSNGWIIPIEYGDIPLLFDWTAGEEYTVGDIIGEYDAIDDETTVYYCIEDHTAVGSFDSTKWTAFPTVYPGPVNAQADIPMRIPCPLEWSLYGLEKIKFCQVNDVMFFAHQNATPRRLTALDFSLGSGSKTPLPFRWAMQEVPFDYAPALDTNETTAALQIQYDYAGWVTATNYAVGDRVIGTDGNLFTCYSAHLSAAGTAPITGASYLTVWNLGTSSATIPNWANATGYTAGNLVKRNKTIYECTVNHTSSNPTKGSFGWIGGNRPGTSQFWTRFWKISGGTFDLSDVELRLQASEDTFAATDVGTVWRATFGIDQGFRRLSLASTGILDPTDSLFIQGSYLVTTNWTTSSAVVGTLIIEESTDNKAWRQVKLFEISDATEGNISYTGDAGSVGAYVRLLADVDTGRAGKSMYLEPASALLTLPIRINAYTDARNVDCSAIMPGDQLVPLNVIGVATTSWRKPAFSVAQGYPAAVAFHDSRLWFGGTTGQPARIWASQLDDFYNFLTGTQDTDGIDLTLSAIKRNEIRWLSSFNRVLVVGTNYQEWTIDGGGEEITITPTEVRARPRTNYGASYLSPEVIEESLLWIPQSQKKVLEFAYSFEKQSYTAPDMSVFLGPGKGVFVSTSYMQNPLTVLWAVDSNGVLYSLFYNREQQITSWSRHTTGESNGDKFENVCCTTTTSNQIWFVVKRGSYRTIEKMSIPETFGLVNDTEYNIGSVIPFVPNHLDCVDTTASVTNVGDNAQILPLTSTPVWIGRSLQVLENSVPLNISPVSAAYAEPGGAIITGWNKGAGSLVIGIPFEEVIQAFPLDVMLQDGTGQSRAWRPNRVMFFLQNSYGGTFGETPDLSAETEIEYPDTPNPLFCGRTEKMHIIADWRRYTQFTIRHADPTPFGLLAYVIVAEASGE